MRVILAMIVIAGCLVRSLAVVVSAQAEPETCPPVCDQIPATAWIPARAVPLDSVYHWPAPAGLAVQITGIGGGARFRFEEVCASATAAVARDPRAGAVAARATVAHPDGQWQLQAQILHWRGDTARGGPTAAAVFGTAVAALRGCQLGAPLESPSVTTDGPDRMAAVLSGPVIVHTYLVVHPPSSTIAELTLWSAAPPQVPWPAMADEPVLNAMAAPLCDAYLASCL